MDPNQSLGYLLNRSARLMAQALAGRLEAHGVSIGQWAVLLFLYLRDGQSQAELSRVVAIEPPTMARTVKRMVRDDLVERREDPRDARLARIYLTDRAQRLRPDLLAAAAETNRVIDKLLGPRDSELLRGLLKVVIDSLEVERPG